MLAIVESGFTKTTQMHDQLKTHMDDQTLSFQTSMENMQGMVDATVEGGFTRTTHMQDQLNARMDEQSLSFQISIDHVHRELTGKMQGMVDATHSQIQQEFQAFHQKFETVSQLLCQLTTLVSEVVKATVLLDNTPPPVPATELSIPAVNAESVPPSSPPHITDPSPKEPQPEYGPIRASKLKKKTRPDNCCQCTGSCSVSNVPACACILSRSGGCSKKCSVDHCYSESQKKEWGTLSYSRERSRQGSRVPYNPRRS